MSERYTSVCEILYCQEEGIANLRHKPRGFALHEGHFIYKFCEAHRAQYLADSTYTEVQWDRDRMRFVEVKDRA